MKYAGDGKAQRGPLCKAFISNNPLSFRQIPTKIYFYTKYHLNIYILRNIRETCRSYAQITLADLPDDWVK